MTIEEMLRQDFAALAARFAGDKFIERTLMKIRRVDRRRLVAVGGAGIAGAAVAASQFAALAGALSDKLPLLLDTSLLAGGGAPDGATAALLATTLVFALVGGATALIAPGGR